jgi:hypothetical protein
MESAVSEYLSAALKRIHACDEARDWVKANGITTLEEAWNKCPKAGWLAWLYGTLASDEKMHNDFTRVVIKMVRHFYDLRDNDLTFVEAVESVLAGEEVEKLDGRVYGQYPKSKFWELGWAATKGDTSDLFYLVDVIVEDDSGGDEELCLRFLRQGLACPLLQYQDEDGTLHKV